MIHLSLDTILNPIPAEELNNDNPTIQTLTEHLKRYDQDYIRLFGSQPVEVTFEGKVLKNFEPTPKTSDKSFIQYHLFFMKEPSQNPTEQFFTGRGWSLEDIQHQSAYFTRLLGNTQAEGFEHNHEAFLEIVHKSSLINEPSKTPIIAWMIMSAFNNNEGYRVQGDWKIKAKNHNVQADHVLLDVFGFPVLITEDKASNMNLAVVQNFDQLKSFSLTAEGAKQDIFYGLVTNFDSWVFTCYIRPESGFAETKHNFLISGSYSLAFQPTPVVSNTPVQNGLYKEFVVQKPTKESTTNVIQLIRGFVKTFSKNVTVDRSGGNPVLKFAEKKLETITEGECKLSFEAFDWKRKFADERERVLSKFKNGEVLVDVFSGNGAMSIRAAKKGLEVYANDSELETCELFAENVEVNGVGETVIIHALSPGAFLKKILSSTKVNHIYMNQPQDAIEHLNSITQAFLQTSAVTYSAQELPCVHLYGFCPKNRFDQSKSSILRRVKDTLKRDMIEDLKVQWTLLQTEISSESLYCLQFQLPLEIVKGEQNKYDKKFGIFVKKHKPNVHP